MIQVRSHKRKRKNKVSVVKKYYKNAVNAFKAEHSIRTPIKVKEVRNSASDSEAHTDSLMKDNIPMQHSIQLERDKIEKNNSGTKKVLHHELGHVLEREKKILRSKKGKSLIKKIKATKSHKKLKNRYQKEHEELFARAYAQKKVGPKKSDVKKGENLTKREFSKIKKYI